MANIVDQFHARFSPKAVKPDAYYDKNDVILFHHIPKAAGTSVGAGIKKVVDSFRTIQWDDVHNGFVRASNDAIYARTEKNMRQVIMGHYNAQNVQFWRNNRLPIKAASIIRDPYERFVSQYNYNCSPKHPAHQTFMERFPTMMSFAKSTQTDFQLRYLLGPTFDLDDALKRLCTDFTFIGCVEHLDASLEHFSKSHGLEPIPTFSLNTGVVKTSEVEVDEEIRALILSKNRNDLKFHKLVLELYA